MSNDIARATYRNPTTGIELTFYTTLLKTHRQTKTAMQNEGYVLVNEQEELANIEHADEALAIARHMSPIEKGKGK